jgi:hypothetical protein
MVYYVILRETRHTPNLCSKFRNQGYVKHEDLQVVLASGPVVLWPVSLGRGVVEGRCHMRRWSAV